jgi:hypothetical protein
MLRSGRRNFLFSTAACHCFPPHPILLLAALISPVTLLFWRPLFSRARQAGEDSCATRTQAWLPTNSGSLGCGPSKKNQASLCHFNLAGFFRFPRKSHRRSTRLLPLGVRQMTDRKKEKDPSRCSGRPGKSKRRRHQTKAVRRRATQAGRPSADGLRGRPWYRGRLCLMSP